MEFKDYYQIMGVERDATQDEIKRAYRKLARKYHPDVSKEGDAETRFKELGEAYAVLQDPEKRAAYDELGANWKAGQEFRPPPDWKEGFEFTDRSSGDGDAADYSEFFESLYGRSSRPGAGSRASFHAQGADRHARVLIELEDAYTGITRTITLRVPEVDAHGRVSMHEHGLSVAIPRGIHAGQHIRLVGQGAPGIGQGKPGDLYLEVEFRPHARYRVDGRDVYLDLPVAPWEAAMGAMVRVPSPNGTLELKIPDDSAAGRKLRLKGRGIPGNPPGDLYVVLQIALPAADTDAAKAFYRNMGEQFKSFDARAKLGVGP